MSHTAKSESHHFPYFYKLQNPIAYTHKLPIIIPYLFTIPITLGFCQNRKIVGSQSESSTKNPKTSSANQNRILGDPKTP